MPTRKQERRDRKRRVHGLERGPAPNAGRARGPRAETRPVAGKAGARGRGKVAPFPSWRRAIRRSALFLGVWAALIAVLAPTSKKPSSVLGSVLIGVPLLLLLVPMTYLIDRTVWRSARKRGLPHEPAPPGTSL